MNSPTSRPAQPPTTARRIGRWAFWSWLGLQIAIPAIQLIGVRPARFGWQMYSSAIVPFELSVTLPTGRQHDLDLASYVAVPREEIDWQALVPEPLCATLPTGTIVTATRGTSRVQTSCE